MHSKIVKERYVAFLRGINVGGHHKLPMADLCKKLEALGFENVITLLNSGNIIFDAKNENIEKIENLISFHLEKTFGFPVPTIIRKSKTITTLYTDDPFQDIKLTKDIRLYVSLLKNNIPSDLKLPKTNTDNSFQIIEIRDNIILSVLDISIDKTPIAMKALEQYFGKDITTRNWNTIERIVKKL